jgi:TatD DNase family protein
MFVDTHCHLDDTSLADRLPEVLARAEAAGVTRFIVPGVGPDCWNDVMAVAMGRKGVFGAPGIHPMRAMQFGAKPLARLEQLCSDAVAVGEIGLDYGYEVSREVQQHAFQAQLRLAIGCGLPVLIHSRRAFADTLALLRKEEVWRVGGVMHAFSGSAEIAAECVKLGLFIGIAGPITYENAIRPVTVVKQIPLEHLLLETDAPDLTPVPHRGKLNEPAFMVETAKKIAEVKGVSLEEVARVTTAGAERLFRLQTWTSGGNDGVERFHRA